MHTTVFERELEALVRRLANRVEELEEIADRAIYWIDDADMRASLRAAINLPTGKETPPSPPKPAEISRGGTSEPTDAAKCECYHCRWCPEVGCLLCKSHGGARAPTTAGEAEEWRKWFKESGNAEFWNNVKCIECELGRECEDHPTGEET